MDSQLFSILVGFLGVMLIGFWAKWDYDKDLKKRKSPH